MSGVTAATARAVEMMALIGYLSAEWVAQTLPRRWADRIAVALARAAFAFRLPARRQLEANLAWLAHRHPSRACTSAETRSLERQARASFEHFALAVTDFLRTPRSTHGLLREVEVRGREHLEAAERAGRGVIVLSAHSGCWEWGAAYLGALGRVVHVVARPHPSPVERFFSARRRRFQVARLIGRPLFIQASRALKRREWVALAGDRAAGRGPAGAPARVSVCAWVAALSRRTGALILPAVMLRLDGGRYAACFDRPLTPEACLNGGYRDALRRLLGGHAEQWSAFEPLPEWLA